MNELRQIEIAYKFCQYLLQENTGSRIELAQKLGISPKWISNYKNKIAEVYKVKISYCRKQQSYFLPNKDYHKLPSYLE